MIQNAWADATDHIKSLCRENGITLEYNQYLEYNSDLGVRVPSCGYYPLSHRIEIVPIHDEIDYYAALHEIGHGTHPKCRQINSSNMGRYRLYANWNKRDIIDNEAYAWEWACSNSIYSVDTNIMAVIKACLTDYYDYYINQAKQIPTSNFLYAVLNY